MRLIIQYIFCLQLKYICIYKIKKKHNIVYIL